MVKGERPPIRPALAAADNTLAAPRKTPRRRVSYSPAYERHQFSQQVATEDPQSRSGTPRITRKGDSKRNGSSTAASSGMRNKAIAHRLGISEGTVKIHIHNMLKKMNCTNRVHLVCMTQDLLIKGEEAF